jgi:glutathione S-transferase
LPGDIQPEGTAPYTVIGATRTRTARVLWLLEELGVPYKHLPAMPRSGDALRHNPAGKVPVLLVGDLALTDSTAIMTFLADAHGRFTAPAGTLARAAQDGMTQRILDECDALLWTASRHSFILPEEMRLPAIKDSLRWEFARNMSALAERLGDGPYLMGAEVTVPDFLLAHCLGWAQSAKFVVEEPRLSRYLERMRARPAYQRAMAR